MISFRSDSLEKGLTIGALRVSAAPRERLHRSANRGQAEGLISDRSRVGLLCKKVWWREFGCDSTPIYLFVANRPRSWKGSQRDHVEFPTGENFSGVAYFAGSSAIACVLIIQA